MTVTMSHWGKMRLEVKSQLLEPCGMKEGFGLLEGVVHEILWLQEARM